MVPVEGNGKRSLATLGMTLGDFEFAGQHLRNALFTSDPGLERTVEEMIRSEPPAPVVIPSAARDLASSRSEQHDRFLSKPLQSASQK